MNVKLENKNFQDNYVRNLLEERGVTDVDKFLSPDYDYIQSWRDLDNIEEGIRLLDKKIKEQAKMALIVDCDVDGVTSSSIIYQYIRGLDHNVQVDYYIHSGKQHGLEDMWEKLVDKDYGLIIIPDAGTNDKVYAEQIPCDILIIDHHDYEGGGIAENCVVINNQMSPNYKNKALCGAGLAYQFCRGLDDFYGLDKAKYYVDLAALGICADMMSGLEIENQAFWKEGFSKVNNYMFMTIARKQAYSITGKMNATDEEIVEALNPTSVAFYIVPMINAMIRVGSQAEKERLFMAFINGHQMVPCNKRGAKGTFEEVAIESARECSNARTRQNKIKDTAVGAIEAKIFKNDLLENKILFIRLDDDDDFPSTLNGLVAAQLCAQYKRPTIIARLNDQGYVRGSIRGLDNSPLESFKSFLLSTNMFEYVQGHDNAAGCSIDNRLLFDFHKKANEELKDFDFGENHYKINFQRCSFDEDILEMIREIGGYKTIWSQKNNEPKIHITDIHLDASDIQIMGKNKDTVKFVVNGVTYIQFKANKFIEEIKEKGNVSMEIIGTANLNYFAGNVTPQIFVQAYELQKENIVDLISFQSGNYTTLFFYNLIFLKNYDIIFI